MEGGKSFEIGEMLWKIGRYTSSLWIIRSLLSAKSISSRRKGPVKMEPVGLFGLL